MRKFLAAILAVMMVVTLSFTGCGTTAQQNDSTAATATSATRTFTDSVGRSVEIPANITKIAVSGPLAQIVLFALAPDELVGIANKWDSSAEQFLDTKYYNLPVIGQLYGGKGELNLETLLNSGAQIVIDVGEPKSSITSDLDALQQQTGIPFVHITCHTNNMGECYRKLGELLGRQDEAEKLAVYCDTVYNKANDIANSVDKKKVLYCLGDQGLNVIAKGSYFAEVIDMLANNAADVKDPSSKGTGNEVDMEQILKWNPDVILFAPGSVYSKVGADSTWGQLAAIKNGKYYEVPMGPYNWMGFPPSVQRLLGMMWMSELLYPEKAGYDMYQETANYFQLFYHCSLTQDQYKALVANSLGK